MFNYSTAVLTLLLSFSVASAQKVFILSGEPSGDQLSNWYSQKLKEQEDVYIEAQQSSSLEFRIASGPLNMLKNLLSSIKLFRDTADHIIENDFDEVVLVDFPFINIPLAWRLKRHKPSIRITYLAPPELWFWGTWNIHKILKRYCDKIIVLYPNEVQWYKNLGLKVEWQGYPYFDKFLPYSDNSKENIIALLPGSRKSELETMLPIFMKVIKKFKAEFLDVKFVIPAATEKQAKYIQEQLGAKKLDEVDVLQGEASKLDTLSKCCLAITKPGTATLELALLGVPSIIAYRVHWSTYIFGKLVVQKKFAGLPNLLANQEISKELLQDKCHPDNIYHVAKKLYESFLSKTQPYNQARKDLEEVKNILEGSQMAPMERKTVVFDFDGTLADTMQLVVKCFNNIAQKNGLEPVENKEIDILRKLEPTALFKRLNISLLKVPFITKGLRTEMKKEINSVKPIEDAIKAIKILKQEGYKIGIITSNSQDNIQAFIKNNRLDLFDFYFCGSSFFGKSTVINRFLKQHGLTPEDVIYVGDGVQDIEAARKSKVKIVAVSWGFSPQELLEKHNADFLVNTQEELVDAIRNLT